MSEEYRLSWEMPSVTTAVNLEARFGRDLTGKLTDEEWEALDWGPIGTIRTEPWDQYNNLQESARTRQQAIRNVKLERRQIPLPDQGWEVIRGNPDVG